MFKEIVHFLQKLRIILPGYTRLQELIGGAISREEKRLSLLIKTNISPESQKQLNGFLEINQTLHELTYLKKEPKHFGAKQIKSEIQKLQQLLPIYNVSRTFLPKLNISNASIKYYSSLVDYYTLYKLKRMNRERVLVYLICFVHYRFRKMNDHLVDCLIHTMNQYTHSAKQTGKTLAYEQQSLQIGQLKKAAKVLDLFNKDQWDHCLFSAVKKVAHNILPPEQFNALIKHLRNQKLDFMEFEWAYYSKIAATIKRNIRPIVSSLNFAANNKGDRLLFSIQFLKQQLVRYGTLQKTNTELFPLETIPKATLTYLYDVSADRKRLNIDKYECLIYQQLVNAFSSGSIFAQESTKYRNFEDDLIPDSVWQNKEILLSKLGMIKLNMPIQSILEHLEEELEYWLERVNARITKQENPHIKIAGKGKNSRWRLPYTSPDTSENHPIFSNLPKVGIIDVLIENNKFCGYTDCFTPITKRYQKTEADPKSLIASIVAMGTYIGLGVMGEISDVSYNTLVSTTHNLIRLETLRMANDVVSNAIAQLPINKYYNILEDIIHASMDGSKIETQIDTYNARHSSKYFGLKKGVSTITLVANHIPINAQIIGAHEHESHFVFDLLFNNTSGVSPNILSTDTNGSNAVNYAILYLFDYTFAPRYKDTSSKIDKIYGFQAASAYVGLPIQPVRKINAQLIVEEWEQIKKIMLSLATKSTTQSIIIGKLSAYERRNRTKSALCEFDHIIQSIHLLKYIDDIQYRQNIQKVLNRGESYNRLRRAVTYANGGKLRVRTEMSQHIYNECSRLLTNNIILYNARLLSKLLAKLETTGVKEDIEQLKRISPVAWRHINIYGKYEFMKASTTTPMDTLINQMNIHAVEDGHA